MAAAIVRRRGTGSPDPLQSQMDHFAFTAGSDRNRPAAWLQPRQASQAAEVLRFLASGWNEILPAEVVRAAACRLLRVHSLRTADAVQLAAATVMAGGRTAHVGFLAFDDRLREAASREGFHVGPEQWRTTSPVAPAGDMTVYLAYTRGL